MKPTNYIRSASGETIPVYGYRIRHAHGIVNTVYASEEDAWLDVEKQGFALSETWITPDFD